MAKLHLLDEHGLLTIQHNEEKLTSKFYDLQKKDVENRVQININSLMVNDNIVFDIGVLALSNSDETVLLSGIHTHVVVVYVIQDNQKLVIGFLTSDKSKLMLSNNQPFNYDNINNKQQRFALLRQPLLVTQTEYLQQLSNCQLIDGTIIKQQQVGRDYINNKEVYGILQQHLKTKVIPQIQKENGLVDLYNGKGVTLKDIDYVLEQADLKTQILVDTRFKDYIQLKNLQNIKKLENWLKNTEKTLDKESFKQLKIKIEIHENKNK